MKFNRLFYIIFVVVFSGVTMVSVLYARPYGRTGRSGKQAGTSCSACHFGPDTPDFEFSTSQTTIMPGETIDMSFTVLRTSSDLNVTTSGFNVAADAGTIIGRNETPEECTDLDEPAHNNITCISEFDGLNEIAQARPTVLEDGEFTYEFSWTAPITPGNYTFYGAGVTAVSGAGAFNTDIHGGFITTTLTVGNDSAPQAPVASFTSTSNNLNVLFDASGSTDADGSIMSYSWNFGDGSSGSGINASHSYTSTGSYTVVLTIEDNDGLLNSTEQLITVSSSSDPEVPVATFTYGQVEGFTVTFDASGSTDNNGIVSYFWIFGDNSFGTGEMVTHTYAAEGAYTVSLEVRDEDGKRNSLTQVVTVGDPPVASESIFLPIIRRDIP